MGRLRLRLRYDDRGLHKLMVGLNLQDATLVGFSMGGGEVARYSANTVASA